MYILLGMISTDSTTSLRLRQADPFNSANDYPFELTIDYKSRGWNPCS